MSKGPGRWQRVIEAALREREWVYLADLLPVDHTRADVVALRRAARSLPAVSLWWVRRDVPSVRPKYRRTVNRPVLVVANGAPAELHLSPGQDARRYP